MADDTDSRTFLSEYHKIVIAKMIRDNKTIIKGVSKGLNIKQNKNRVWQDIFDKVTELGGVIPNVAHLRKVSYEIPLYYTKKLDMSTFNDVSCWSFLNDVIIQFNIFRPSCPIVMLSSN